MKKALFALFSMLFILLFLLVFFTLQGHTIRHIEIENALELSMKQAMTQLQFDEGAPSSEEEWLEDFSESLSSQIESESDLTVHIYEADINKGLLSAEGILTYRNFIGTESSVSTGKRTVLIEGYILPTEEDLDKETEVDKSNYVITDNVDSLNLNKEQTPSNNINGNNDSADTNTDEVVTTQEATDHISPSEQAMIDAGYGNVVLLPTGNYGVLMPNPDCLINGKDGGDILIEYLAEKGLQASSVSGCWMNDQYYNWIAKNITELITPDDEEFWD